MLLFPFQFHDLTDATKAESVSIKKFTPYAMENRMEVEIDCTE